MVVRMGRGRRGRLWRRGCAARAGSEGSGGRLGLGRHARGLSAVCRQYGGSWCTHRGSEGSPVAREFWTEKLGNFAYWQRGPFGVSWTAVADGGRKEGKEARKCAKSLAERERFLAPFPLCSRLNRREYDCVFLSTSFFRFASSTSPAPTRFNSNSCNCSRMVLSVARLRALKSAPASTSRKAISNGLFATAHPSDDTTLGSVLGSSSRQPCELKELKGVRNLLLT